MVNVRVAQVIRLRRLTLTPLASLLAGRLIRRGTISYFSDVALLELALGRYNQVILAGIAQLVEQLLRKQLVGGSSPLSGTKFSPFNRR